MVGEEVVSMIFVLVAPGQVLEVEASAVSDVFGLKIHVCDLLGIDRDSRSDFYFTGRGENSLPGAGQAAASLDGEWFKLSQIGTRHNSSRLDVRQNLVDKKS